MKFSNDPVHKFYLHDEFIEKCLKKDEILTNAPTITEFFANREIFITGGTGFIGKVLIEKLLRSCPDVKVIYVLIRPKKGQNIEERMASVFSSILFDLLKKINPKFIQKLVPIPGDVSEIGLGISEVDRSRLKNVSVVFHSAASVRFNDPIRNAIFLNTRGTHELIKLCQTFKELKVILHVSTAYCNCCSTTVEEKIYPALADWRKAIETCEKMENDDLDVLTQHFTNFMPNTYLFSKHLAERVLYDYKDVLPISIVRPSIVVSAINDPFCGYVSSWNRFVD